jgi:hypothetical protein
MSLDVTLFRDGEEVFSANITHNLATMAIEAGIYDAVWRPDENGIERAADIATVLEPALRDMKHRPAHYAQFDSPNGWGTYEDFLPWIEEYLAACLSCPDAVVDVSR